MANAIRRIMEDPTASKWLKEAAIAAEQRDLADALNDAEALAAALKERFEQKYPTKELYRVD